MSHAEQNQPQPGGGPEPKIFVDEDYKSRVAAEKEALRRRQQQQEQHQGRAAGPEAGRRPGSGPEPVPPASFALLVTTLAAQAMAALGQAPDPLEGRPLVRLDLARHHIDMLDVLQQKTQGNLTAEEAALLDNALHELRLLYIQVQTAAPAAQEPKKT